MNFTHEIKEIIQTWALAQATETRCVLATVVDLDGSSYRNPGVRMLLTDKGSVVGAVSGGCVENKVAEEAQKVFDTGIARMMTYDGRFRLGCEGVLYLLLEPFAPSLDDITALQQGIDQRQPFSTISYYVRSVGSAGGIGTMICMGNRQFCVNATEDQAILATTDRLTFRQDFEGMFQLVIFGSEYDAARLSRQAALLGWHVTLVASPYQAHRQGDFPGVRNFVFSTPEQLPVLTIDDQTAVVLMTHNYAKDLAFLLAIQQEKKPCYIGLLGATKRREKLLDDFFLHSPDIFNVPTDLIHGPAGLDIGSETAEEIALSICAEILAVQRSRDAGRLSDLKKVG